MGQNDIQLVEMEYTCNVNNNIQMLCTMWFSKIVGYIHEECLECFYGLQAHACKFFYMLFQFSKKISTFLFHFLGD